MLVGAQEVNGMTNLHPVSKRLRKPIGGFDVTRKCNDEIAVLVSFFVLCICAKVYSLLFQCLRRLLQMLRPQVIIETGK